MIDLAKGVKDKTQKKIEHISISCAFQSRARVLGDVLLIHGGKGKTIIFTATRRDANEVVSNSQRHNLKLEAIHGDVAQAERERILKKFRDGKINVLVATDVAARGIDIPNVDLVIQLEPPNDSESYIHRSGRTARAGQAGKVITFYTKL